MQKNLGYVIPSIVIPDETNDIGYWYLGNVPLGVRATGTRWTIGNDHYWYLDGSKTNYLAEIPVETYNQQFATMLANYSSSFNEWFNEMKDQLSEDAAGHLQLEIDALHADIGLDYDSYEEAMDDIANIPEGARVFTPEPDETIQDIIDGMTALHLAGSQVGAGTKNFTFNTEAQKRMLCITKKSGVIVESKEIPVDVLDTDDVILLGNTSPVIGGSGNPNLVGKALYLYSNSLADNPVTVYSTTGSHIGDHSGITLTTDSSNTTGATLTYNGNNSFTINVADSTLSVYVYVDMLVLGGSASGRNVSVNLAGTDLVSTDAEGAILEVYEKVREGAMRIYDTDNPLHTFDSSHLSFTTTKDCYVYGSLNTIGTSEVVLYFNNTAMLMSKNYYAGGSQGSGAVNVDRKVKAGTTVRLNTMGYSILHIFDVLE